jgi:choline dehydrogenase-like flavoprotein
MALHLPSLLPSRIDKVEYQETSFTIDALARNVCNTWEEAMTNPAFDHVVIGGGMYGAYCADKLFRDPKAQAKRTLLLEAGPFLIAEHVQDLPDIGLNVPDPLHPNDPANGDDKLSRDFVWKIPWRGNTAFPGSPYCVGGKSLYWGGWCPRLTYDDLESWPPSAAHYLKENYSKVELDLGVSSNLENWKDKRTGKVLDGNFHFIHGPLYEAMLAKTEEVLPHVADLTTVEKPPLAVMGPGGGSGLFSLNKYSSVPLLISAIRDAIKEAGYDDGRRRLFLVPKARVLKLHTSGGVIRRIGLVVNGQQRFLDIPPGCVVVLALGAIESTRLALESFSTRSNPAEEKMGRNLTVHMRSNKTFRIKRTVLLKSGKRLPEVLQTAALLVRGKTNDGHFHLQVTAADAPDGNSDGLLFRVIPDRDQLKKILEAQRDAYVAVTFRGCAETKGVKDRPKDDSSLRWIDLSPTELDQFGFRRAYVKLDTNSTEKGLWESMDTATEKLALKLADDDQTAIERTSSDQDGLGTTYHESGTLWMGDEKERSVTDTNGRFHHIDNAYCVDQSLFPTVGSVNPALTGLTLTRKIAEHIATLKNSSALHAKT